MKRRNFLGWLAKVGIAQAVMPSALLRVDGGTGHPDSVVPEHSDEVSSRVEVKYLDCEIFEGTGPCRGEACKFCANVECKRMREYLGMQEVSDER